MIYIVDGCGMFMHVVVIDFRTERFKRKRVHIDAIFGRPFCSFVFALFVHTSGFDLGNCDFGFRVLVSALVHGQIQLSVLEWAAYLFMACVCWLSIWDFETVTSRGWEDSGFTCALIFIFYAISGDLFARCTRLQMG